MDQYSLLKNKEESAYPGKSTQPLVYWIPGSTVNWNYGFQYMPGYGLPLMLHPDENQLSNMCSMASPLVQMPAALGQRFPSNLPDFSEKRGPVNNMNQSRPNGVKKKTNQQKIYTNFLQKNDEMSKKVFAKDELLSETYGDDFGTKNESNDRVSDIRSRASGSRKKGSVQSENNEAKLIFPKLVKRDSASFHSISRRARATFEPKLKMLKLKTIPNQLKFDGGSSYSRAPERNLGPLNGGFKDRIVSSELQKKKKIERELDAFRGSLKRQNCKSTIFKNQDRKNLFSVIPCEGLYWNNKQKKLNFMKNSPGLYQTKRAPLPPKEVKQLKKITNVFNISPGLQNFRKSIQINWQNDPRNLFKKKSFLKKTQEENIARDYNAGLIKLQTNPIKDQFFKKNYSDFTKIQHLDLKNDLLVEPMERGSLLNKCGKELVVQCQNCKCAVAKIETSRRNFFISTPSSNQIYANFKLNNVTPLLTISEAYPLQNLKKILVSMLLRQKIEPQMLDLNIFEIKLLHAVLIKRFKRFYTNSDSNLNKSEITRTRALPVCESFHEFLESKRVHSSHDQVTFKDTINQKHIFYTNSHLKGINKHQLTSAFLNVLVENEPSKRLEEQLKFVLSRAEQSLIVDFLEKVKNKSPEEIDKSLKTNRYAVEVEFYKRYFSEFAKGHRIPIEKFYFPRNKNKLVSNSHKTINKSYMRNITLNRDYVQKMVLHIRSQLLKLEKQTIRVKINNKIEKWNSFLLRKLNFEKEENILELFDSFIQKNILSNDKFKLPWSVKQIESAITIVLDHLR